MKARKSVAEIRQVAEVYVSECGSILLNLRLWISGIGAVFVLAVGGVLNFRNAIQGIPSAERVLVFLAFVILVMNILCLAAAILTQEVAQHGLKCVALNPSCLSDQDVERRYGSADRWGGIASFIIMFCAFLSAAFLVLCLVGMWLFLFL